MGPINFCRAGLILLFTFVSTWVTSLLAIVIGGVFRRPASAVQVLPRTMWRVISWMGNIKVRVEGGEFLDKEKPYIFAANHQSMYDIIAMQGFLDFDFRWMAKKELFNIPFFGTAMRFAGYISIDRSRGRQAMQSLIAAAGKIANGDSVVIFPEGTRSADGNLHPFKAGAMVLAIKAGVPLVPVAIIGTHKILPKKKLLLRSGEVLIRIGKPIETTGYTSKQKQELAQIVHDQVAELMG